MAQQRISIGLVGLGEAGVDAGIRQGVLQYLRPHLDWRVVDAKHDRSLFHQVLAARVWGIIAHVTEPAFAQQLARLRKPVVNLSMARPSLRFPTVAMDNHQAGAVAAEHLLERGFRHFGCMLSVETFHYESLRRSGFMERIEQAGLACAVFDPTPVLQEPDPVLRSRRRQRSMHRWLEALPKPAGILCVTDRNGVQLADDCRAIDLRVPEDIALVGIDDTTLTCQSALPPLSSVRCPSVQVGTAAVRLLHAMIEGQPAPDAPILLPPLGVTVRQSSDIFAVDDPKVRRAMHLIHRHAAERIRIQDVVDELRIDRRDLERRFRKHLNRTPLEELHRVQVERAKDLLMRTLDPMSEIAHRAGFRDNNHFAILFKRVMGISPSQFRKQATPRVGPSTAGRRPRWRARST